MGIYIVRILKLQGNKMHVEVDLQIISANKDGGTASLRRLSGMNSGNGLSCCGALGHVDVASFFGIGQIVPFGTVVTNGRTDSILGQHCGK